MAKYVPTKAERDVIKKVAYKLSRRNGNGTRGVHIEPGERYNLDDRKRGLSINLRIVSDDPNWNDTDLNQTLPWTYFSKGFDLSEKGEAEIDFYLYEKLFGDHGDLCCNLQAIFDKTGLIRLDADGDGTVWKRGEAA